MHDVDLSFIGSIDSNQSNELYQPHNRKAPRGQENCRKKGSRKKEAEKGKHEGIKAMERSKHPICINFALIMRVK